MAGKAVAIVGPGRVGTAMALALRDQMSMLGAAGGSQAAQDLFRRRTGLMIHPSAPELCRAADWVFLTVPDRAVRPLAAELGEAGAFRAGQVVVHTAGALPSEALRAAQAHGADILALHPMQSFADPELGPRLFDGITCTLEGTPGGRSAGEGLAYALGMRPWQVAAEDKPRLHAACSLASNALVALLSVAASTAAGSDDPARRAEALQALLPLSRGSVENLLRLGLPQALTGPVERGDLGTVEAHLDLLQGPAEEIYRTLGLVAVALAREKGSLPPPEADRLSAMLRR